MSKVRKRVVIDRTAWQKIREIDSEESRNLSKTIARLLEDYLPKEDKVKTKSGPKELIDITIDNNLWERASRHAMEKDISTSHLIRQLLKKYIETVNKNETRK